MTKDIHLFCKLGIVHSMAFPESSSSSSEFIRTLKKILNDSYFTLVEIGKLPFPELNSVVPDMIRAAGADFTYCGHSRLFANKLNINDLDEEKRLAAVEELKRGLDEAKAFGVKEFQFLSRQCPEDKIEQGIEQLAKSTRELCAYANKLDIKVALEIFDHDIDKCSLLGPADRVKKFLEKVSDIENFGIMVDCSHIPMIREPLSLHMNTIKGKIFHAHMGNTYIKDKNDPAYGDLHPRFGYPESENDASYLASYLQYLLDFGYLKEGGDNYLSFEVRPVLDEDRDMVIANAKRTLAEAWKKVVER